MLIASLASFAPALLTLAATFDGPHAIGLSVPIQTPLLIDATHTVDATLQGEVGGREIEVTVSFEGESRYLDVYSVLTETEEVGQRTCVFAREETNGEVNDPPFTGLVYDVRSDQTNGFRIEIANDRVVPLAHLNRQLNAAYSMWIWVGFPAEASIGDEFDVDLRTLGALLFGDELAHDEASATVTFDAFEPETGTATFSGTASAVGRPIDETEGTTRATGTIRFVTVPAEGRVAEIAFDGTLEISGEKDGVAITGIGTLESAIETALAPEDYEAPAPAFRLARKTWSEGGLSLALPSSWSEMEVADTQADYFRTLDEESGQAIISLHILPGDGLGAGAFKKAVVAQFKKEHPGTRSKSVNAPIGKGFTTWFDQRNGERDLHIRAEYYPLGENWLIYKLSGDAAACKKALEEFVTARKTLRRG